MTEFLITLTNGDRFFVKALSAIHARQIAAKRLRSGEEIDSIKVA